MDPHDLKAIPIFSSLDGNQLRLILSKCRRASTPRGTVIIGQDEDGCDLYYIIDGAVKISRIHKDGREVILDTLQKGDFFGELSFVDSGQRSATVTALIPSTILILPREHFLKLLKKNGDIGIGILSVLASRLRKADETIETLTFLDVAGRVAKLLMEYAGKTGPEEADGSIRIKGITHRSIADQVGASREAVTKALKNLAARNLIRIRRSEIILLRPR